MTSYDIQQGLMVERYRRSFCLPNYTPRNWYECDVFELTAAGYMREYEIKLSLSDFKADQAKCNQSSRDFKDGRWVDVPGRKKHQRLAERDQNGPTFFWFVAPKGLIPLELLPDWAGLIECADWSSHAPPWRVRLSLARKAPRLHNKFPDPKVRQHAEGVCYWRFHSAFLYHKFNQEVAA